MSYRPAWAMIPLLAFLVSPVAAGNDAAHTTDSVVLDHPDTIPVGLLRARIVGMRRVAGPEGSSRIVDGARLRARDGDDLARQASHIASVSILSTGPSVAKPVVRGFHSDRVAVLLLDVPVEGQSWGGDHAPEIDPFLAQTLEVWEGPTPLVAGSGAIGGAIRLVPDDLPDLPVTRAEGLLGGKPAGRDILAGARLTHRPVAWPIAWRAQAHLRRSGDNEAPGYVLDNTGQKNFSTTLEVGGRSGSWRLHTLATRYDRTAGLLTDAHVGNTTDLLAAIARGGPARVREPSWSIDRPAQQVTHDLALVSGTRNCPSRTATFTLSAQHDRRKEFDLRSARQADLTGPQLDFRLRTLDARTRHGITAGSLRLEGGASATLQDNVWRGQRFVPNFARIDGGIWMHVGAGDRMRSGAGVRVEHRSLSIWDRDAAQSVVRTNHHWTTTAFQVSAGGQLPLAWNHEVVITRAMRAPLAHHLASRGVHHGTASWEEGDPALGPETLLGMAWRVQRPHRRLLFQAGTTLDHVDNHLQLVPLGEPVVSVRGAYPSWKWSASDVVRAAGEVEARAMLTEAWSVGARGAWVRLRSIQNEAWIADAPADRLRLEVERKANFDSRFATLRAGLEHHPGRDRSAPRDLGPDPPGATLVDLHATLQGKTHAWRLHLDLHNALDATWRRPDDRLRWFAAQPGRTLDIRLSVQI